MSTVVIDFPGVQVIDRSAPVNRAIPFGVCYMLGSATTGASKHLTKVTSYDDFTTLFGDASDSDPYVEAFFENANNSVEFYFYRVNSGTGVASVPPEHEDYIEAISMIDPTAEPGGIIIAPEYFATANITSANRLEFAEKVNSFCNTDEGSYWIAFVDTAPDNVTAQEVVTDKNTHFISPKGNLFTYAPYYVNTDDVTLVPSAAMAAIALSAWSDGRYFVTPAGSGFSIKGVKKLLWNPSKTDLALFHSEGVNAIRRFNSIDAYVPYDSISVSSSVEFFQLNSVVCYKVVAFLLFNAVLPLVHSSLYGTAEALTNMEAVINKVLYDAWTSGYLVGRNGNEAFDVQSNVERLPAPNAAIANFICSVRPSYSIQKIVIYLQNVLAQVN